MHRSTFSPDEIEVLRASLLELRRAERNRQIVIRASMRRMGFYITDYAADFKGFTASDLDQLIARGVIEIGS